MAKTREIVADILVDAGVEYVFGMPGGCNTFQFDPFFDRKDKIKVILARNEQCASGMADMIGRLTGKPAAILAQGAWLATSAGLGIIEAYLAGSPMLVMAEMSDYGGLVQHMPYQCLSGEYGSIDGRNILKGMTKYTSVANSPSEYIHGIMLAIKHSMTGKPGPCAVLPRWNVVTSECDPAALTPPLYPVQKYLNVRPACLSAADADQIAEYLINAKDPLIIAGQGVHMSKSYAELEELAVLLGIPVATSTLGKSAMAETHDLALGPTGNLGQKVANEKVISADLIFAVGTGLAPENNKMLPAAGWIRPMEQKIIQIDIEPLNIGFTYPVEFGATTDAKLGLKMIIEAVKARKPRVDVKARVAALLKAKAEKGYFQDAAMGSDASPIAPERFIKDLNDSVSPDDLIVMDGGNNRIYMGKYFQSKRAGQVIAPGGVTPIGWSVTASLAAQIHYPKRRVISVCGDGGFMLQLYGLEMSRQYNLPITHVIMNNSALGNVMDFQPDNRRVITEYDEPHFAGIAKAVGLEGFKVDKAEDLKPALHEALNNGKPTVVDVTTSKQKHFKVMMG